MAATRNLKQIFDSSETISSKCLQIMEFYSKPNYLFFNREETIFDWLCDTINSNTELTDDINHLWFVMVEILQASSLSYKNKLNQSHRKVVLTTSVPKLILKQLKTIAETPFENTNIRDNIFKSLNVIISCENLANVFMQQPLLLLKIFEKILGIYKIYTKREPREDDAQIEDLILQIAKFLSSHSNRKSGLGPKIPQKEFFKRIFGPLVSVICQLHSANLENELIDLLQLFFCKREVIKQFGMEYKNYLDSEKTLPTASYSTLLELIIYVESHYNVDNSDGLTKILGLVLECLHQKCLKEVCDTPFKFLSLALKSIKILPPNQDQDLKAKLLTLERLLLSSSKYKSNILIEGTVSRENQVKWFRELYNFLLSLNPEADLEGHWYTCLKLLALFSPEIVEPAIQNTWKLAWLNRLNCKDSMEEQGEFLSQILEDYVNLRQVPKLFLKLSLAILEDDPKKIKEKHLKSLPKKFSTDLAKIILKLRATQLVELWETLLNTITKQNKVMSQSIVTTVEVLVILMTHTRLSDGGIPTSLYSKLAKLMANTANLASNLNLEGKSSNNNKLRLALINAWCSVRLALKLFCPNYEDNLELKKLTENDKLFNLDIIFPEANDELAEVLHKSVQSKDSNMIVLVLKILVQKANAICVAEHLSTPAAKMALVSIASFMYSEITEMIEESYPSDLYTIQLKYLPLFHLFLSAKKLSEVLAKILNSVATPMEKSVNINSASEITHNFLRSSYFNESKRMQTASVTALLTRLNYIMNTEKQNLKRKNDEDETKDDKNALKIICVNSKIWDLTPILPREKSDDSNPTDNKTWKLIKEAGARLTTFFEETKGMPDLVSKEEELLKFLLILKSLGPENFALNNSLRCIVALLYLRSGLSSLDEKHQYFFAKIDHLLFILIEKLDAYYLTNLIEGDNLLKEILRINRSSPHGKERDFWMDKVTDRILFLSLHNQPGLQNLAKLLKDVENSSDSFRDIHFLQITLRILVHKIQGGLFTRKPEYAQLSQTLAARVSLILREKLISVKRFKGLEENEKFYAYQFSLRGFQSLIDFYSTSHNGKNEEDAKDNLRILLKKFKSFLSLSLENLEGENDIQLVETALSTIISVLTQKESNEEYLPPSFALECWKKVQIQIKLQVLTVNGFRICKALKSFEDENVNNQYDSDELSFKTLGVALEDTLSLALKTIITKATQEELEEIFNSLQEASYTCGSNFIASDFQTILYTWLTLLEIDFGTIDTSRLKSCFQTFFRTLILLLLEGQEECSNLEEVVIPSLEFLSRSISRGFSHYNNVAECLQICSFISPKKYAKTEPVKLTATLINYIIVTLNEVLHKHSAQILASSATFIAIVSKVTIFLVELGEQNSFNILIQRDQGLIISCIQKLEKLVSLMSNHTKSFAKAVIYLIAEYIHQIQQYTLFPSVKELFVPVLNKLFNLCDEHFVAVLRISLDEGGREILDIMYKDYQKYYKYKGKI